MAELGITWEREGLGGGRYRHTQSLRPIGYLDGFIIKRIVSTWAASGISERPHIVTASRMMVSVADDGMRRIHPTREADRYMEIGAPYVKVGGVWKKVGFTSATRTGSSITWHRPQADLRITHGGHFIKLDIELLGGYVPEDNLIAFPVGLTGLTRSGAQIRADGETVALLRAPVVKDAANRLDIRPIAYQFTTLSGQPYLVMTLPSLTGMARPVIDPTLTLQPDAAAGKDATITTEVPTWNFGINAVIPAGEGTWAIDVIYRSLLQFDISAIPASATITSAMLSLWLNSAGAAFASNDRSVECRRVLRAWVEGTRVAADDAPATGATWGRYDLINNWGTAGCANVTDREAASIGSHGMLVADAVNSQHDFALTPGAGGVQDWIDGTLSNNGVLLQADTELNDFYEFCSSDHATAGQRPRIIVDYTLAGNPWYAYRQQ